MSRVIVRFYLRSAFLTPSAATEEAVVIRVRDRHRPSVLDAVVGYFYRNNGCNSCGDGGGGDSS